MALFPLTAYARKAWACDARRSRGRLFAEDDSPTRTPFQRDRDRIIHSTAFRRLAHKTQVFVSLDGDHFRTRLTHTIEVAQIARSLARALSLDDDLAEAVALAHDLGHTPFGHAGESALEACMKDHGGFDHNAQALRVVTLLERRYARHDGLNLSFETLEGLVKHNGPLVSATRPVSRYVAQFDETFPLDLSAYASAEAQAAALADDIAYNAHDLDDGLRAGLFELEEIAVVPFVDALLDDIRARYGALEPPRLIHELSRRVITCFVEDAILESQRRIEETRPSSADNVRRMGAPLIAFSPTISAADRAIKDFLFPKMYRHQKIMGVWDKATLVVSSLFPAFLNDPSLMPTEWALQARKRKSDERARVVADYIAGMTDRYALSQYNRIFGREMELR